MFCHILTVERLLLILMFFCATCFLIVHVVVDSSLLSQYECGQHGRFEYCINSEPDCVVGCHCHPGFFLSTTSNICEPSMILELNTIKASEKEPNSLSSSRSGPNSWEDRTMPKEVDGLRDWLYENIGDDIEKDELPEMQSRKSMSGEKWLSHKGNQLEILKPNNKLVSSSTRRTIQRIRKLRKRLKLNDPTPPTPGYLDRISNSKLNFTLCNDIPKKLIRTGRLFKRRAIKKKENKQALLLGDKSSKKKDSGENDSITNTNPDYTGSFSVEDSNFKYRGFIKEETGIKNDGTMQRKLIRIKKYKKLKESDKTKEESKEIPPQLPQFIFLGNLPAQYYHSFNFEPPSPIVYPIMPIQQPILCITNGASPVCTPADSITKTAVSASSTQVATPSSTPVTTTLQTPPATTPASSAPEIPTIATTVSTPQTSSATPPENGEEPPDEAFPTDQTLRGVNLRPVKIGRPNPMGLNRLRRKKVNFGNSPRVFGIRPDNRSRTAEIPGPKSHNYALNNSKDTNDMQSKSETNLKQSISKNNGSNKTNGSLVNNNFIYINHYGSSKAKVESEQINNTQNANQHGNNERVGNMQSRNQKVVNNLLSKVGPMFEQERPSICTSLAKSENKVKNSQENNLEEKISSLINTLKYNHQNAELRENNGPNSQIRQNRLKILENDSKHVNHPTLIDLENSFQALVENEYLRIKSLANASSMIGKIKNVVVNRKNEFPTFVYDDPIGGIVTHEIEFDGPSKPQELKHIFGKEYIPGIRHNINIGKNIQINENILKTNTENSLEKLKYEFNPQFKPEVYNIIDAPKKLHQIDDKSNHGNLHQTGDTKKTKYILNRSSFPTKNKYHNGAQHIAASPNTAQSTPHRSFYFI